MKRRMLTLTLLGLALACSERAAPPTEPDITTDPVPDAEPPPPETSARGALEALARQLALALGSDAFRAELRQQLDLSPLREHKLPAAEFLAASRPVLAQAALVSAADPGAITSLAGSTIPAELYFPVPGHREAWDGGTHVLVATAMDDEDAPVAFDTEGRRYRLDPLQPPAIPVLALVPRETHRPRIANAKCTSEECGQAGGGGGTAGGGPGGPGLSAGSLTLTHAEFSGTFEGWLKGKPEFELHILGPVSPSDTSTMMSYQCIGEHAPPDYFWDMNNLSWDGQAKMFSFEQMDAFEQAYPGRAYLVFAVEDDSRACVITSNADHFKAMVDVLRQAYDEYTAAKDQKIGFNDADRILKAAQTGAKVLSAIASFITTKDDPIGIAVQNSVSGRFHPAANWVVLNEDNAVTGWLKLEMR